MSLTSYRTAPPRGKTLGCRNKPVKQGRSRKSLFDRYAPRQCAPRRRHSALCSSCSDKRLLNHRELRFDRSRIFRPADILLNSEDFPRSRTTALARPGDDLLSHALRRSTIGAEGLHGRVRNGIGCGPFAIATRSCKDRCPRRNETTEFYRILKRSRRAFWHFPFGRCCA